MSKYTKRYADEHNKRSFFLCGCGIYDHMFAVSYWDDSAVNEPLVYIDVHMVERPLLKRIWYAVKYIVKGEMEIGHWYEVLLERYEVGNLITFLEGSLEDTKNNV